MQTRSSPSLQTLHRLARHASIEDYERLPKPILFDTLKDRYNFDRLLRSERRNHSSGKCYGAKKRRKPLYSALAKSRGGSTPSHRSERHAENRVKLNDIDPIMMVPIGKAKTFVFTRPNGTQVQFLVDSLADYLLTTGDFTDPETRIPFSDEDLASIDRLVSELNLGKGSVLAARRDSKRYSEVKFRRDALLGLERCAGEVVADMLEVVETFEPDDAQLQLATCEFPLFLDYYRQLRDAEPEYASKCISHWRLFVAGPPNRPNQDDYGLIQAILHFLRSCEDRRL